MATILVIFAIAYPQTDLLCVLKWSLGHWVWVIAPNLRQHFQFLKYYHAYKVMVLKTSGGSNPGIPPLVLSPITLSC